MKVKEDYCYLVAKDFSVEGISFKQGDKIVTYRVDKEETFFCKKDRDDDYSTLPENELAEKLDMPSGVDYFGTCENCGCELRYLPNGGWGVGYVCGSCAQELRGDLDY